MIAVDTSSPIAFLAGDEGNDVTSLDEALALHRVVLPPVVLTEMSSAPRLETKVSRLIRRIPTLEPHAGDWERTGQLRAKLLVEGLRARLADALIAQSCLDHRTPLITRDSDFRHFVAHAGLEVVGA